jgi:hypothetical protein
MNCQLCSALNKAGMIEFLLLTCGGEKVEPEVSPVCTYLIGCHCCGRTHTVDVPIEDVVHVDELESCRDDAMRKLEIRIELWKSVVKRNQDSAADLSLAA